MTYVDLQPDDLEVLQAETPEVVPAAAVIVQGVVRTQDLPRKSAASRNRSLGTGMTKLLAADDRRAMVRLMSIGATMQVAFSQASTQDPSMCIQWPANTPLEITASCEVWAAALTGTTIVSIMTEYWATGE